MQGVFFDKNRACMSFPNPRHSSDSTAEKAREQRCFTSLWELLQPPCLMLAMPWDSPQSTSANPPSLHTQPCCSSSAHLEWQVMPACSLRAGAALRTAARVLIKPKQLHSCHRNMFVVLQLSVGDVQRASKPWQCISSPFSGPGLHC